MQYNRIIFYGTSEFQTNFARHISCSSQGELEHHTPKLRYKRTSKKNYLRQLTQIERHQVRIRHIRRGLNEGKNPFACNGEPEYASNPMVQYHIGKSQNEPVVLPIFLQENCGDPAIKVNNAYRWLSLS